MLGVDAAGAMGYGVAMGRGWDDETCPDTMLGVTNRMKKAPRFTPWMVALLMVLPPAANEAFLMGCGAVRSSPQAERVLCA